MYPSLISSEKEGSETDVRTKVSRGLQTLTPSMQAKSVEELPPTKKTPDTTTKAPRIKKFSIYRWVPPPSMIPGWQLALNPPVEPGRTGEKAVPADVRGRPEPVWTNGAGCFGQNQE